MDKRKNCSFNSKESPCQCSDYYGKKSSVVNLGSCDFDIQEYLIKYGISGVKNIDGITEISESDLILNRAGKFNVSSEEKKTFSICTYHRQYLTTHWPGCKRSTCTYPEHQGKKVTFKKPRRVTRQLSESIYGASGYVVSIGSGMNINRPTNYFLLQILFTIYIKFKSAYNKCS